MTVGRGVFDATSVGVFVGGTPVTLGVFVTTGLGVFVGGAFVTLGWVVGVLEKVGVGTGVGIGSLYIFVFAKVHHASPVLSALNDATIAETASLPGTIPSILSLSNNSCINEAISRFIQPLSKGDPIQYVRFSAGIAPGIAIITPSWKSCGKTFVPTSVVIAKGSSKVWTGPIGDIKKPSTYW
ncbi:hypothetical protein COU88_04060 [Candidatus Roizmanbacteria bacterium CG10_big_fil_rev_8_21_14_0_10_39_6]|uniref:Uncharacterized protein n=1 Tax=Candidatus Roizmanbacteria bacterium CG10_big_fil_rev_8_21_14_0_10_39_6 TaxID=1974853 RepID=A0A2M8KRS1_9BACT|nr:MAG: hypothetical protein COU88_04060 [Candidatus Roizmanbacteria bacterium CG10_big_fil_rev_8_21_14_0_10_39_6]